VKDSIRKNLEEERTADPVFSKKLLQEELKKANIRVRVNVSFKSLSFILIFAFFNSSCNNFLLNTGSGKIIKRLSRY
jgi:hypothetical protein